MAKAVIRWLKSDDPEDFDNRYRDHAYPIKKLIGDVTEGNVCTTLWYGKPFKVLVVAVSTSGGSRTGKKR